MAAVRVRASVVAVATAAVTLALSATASALPIADAGTPSLPNFSGAAATAQKVKDPTKAPQNPFMATNPNSNIHNDTWMTDAYQRSGPLGNDLQATSGATPPSLCGSIPFDTPGPAAQRLPVLGRPAEARMIDPNTLEVISEFTLPTAPNPPGTKEYQNFTGGGYFFLDNKDRMWVPTKTDHIFVLNEGADGKHADARARLRPDRGARPATQRITSALPDFNGLIWFVSKIDGKVGTLNPKTGEIKVKTMNEEIENSFAVGEDGVYIVSDKRMYRFKATKNGHPEDRLAEGLSELRDRQAEPGQRRLRHDADDHGRTAWSRSPTTPTR